MNMQHLLDLKAPKNAYPRHAEDAQLNSETDFKVI